MKLRRKEGKCQWKKRKKKQKGYFEGTLKKNVTMKKRTKKENEK
jgi:hypothetical protein